MLAVTNFPPKQIEPFVPECLITGLKTEAGAVALVAPDFEVKNGERRTKTYSLNTVYQKQLDLFKDANDEDEEDILNEAN